MKIIPFILILSAFFVGTVGADSATLTVTSVQPTPRIVTAPTNTAITINFDQPLNTSTITSDSFWAFGRWSGPANGTISFANSNQTAILTPSQPFSAGETVMVILGNTIQSASGMSLRSAGYSFQFWTATNDVDALYQRIDTLIVRDDPNVPVRAYGGVATDFDNDGWLDLSILNEFSDDLRFYRNQADGTGAFDAYTEPTQPLGDTPSPNEPSDFDQDGNPDLAVLNIGGDSVTILLGNGDGTFTAKPEATVANDPRGLAVLDIDGDGDTDVATANHDGNNITLLFNDGNGNLSGATDFEGGGNGEWGLASADMNNDGILDLVVSTRYDTVINVHLSNGDGTFTQSDSQSANGWAWMLSLGDLNGDGNVDVAGGSRVTGTGFGDILLGDGAGNVGTATSYPTDVRNVATDLGDADGDGDLDWVISSFGGDFTFYLNDGDGTFTFEREFDSPAAASCSLFFDFDNDGDLDLALIDELDDVVFLEENETLPTAIGLDAQQVTNTQLIWLLLIILLAITVWHHIFRFR